MYKVYYENRFIVLSSQPDRLQKYSLFYKFHDESDLYLQIDDFIRNDSIRCINLYSYKIDHLWLSFCKYFKNLEAAGGLVKYSDDRLLFIRRFDKWDIPKGHIDIGETAGDCALREVAEECGIRADTAIYKLSPSYHIYIYRDTCFLKTTHWFYMTYSGNPATVPQASEGITSAEWIGKERLPEILSGTWLSVADVIQEVRLKFLLKNLH